MEVPAAVGEVRLDTWRRIHAAAFYFKRMPELSAFFRANLIPIFFIYGLAHFVTGFAVLLETGRTSQLRLSRALPFLAAFGVTHGINEWIEMFSLISREIPTVAREPEWAEIVKIGWMALSFFLLFEFAARLLIQLVPEYRRWLRWLPLLAVLIYFASLLGAGVLTGSASAFAARVDLGDMLARYTIGFPASLAASIAMLAQRRAFLRENMPQFGRDLVGASLALAWYAVLDQLVGPQTPYFPSSVLNENAFMNLVGVPVELVRTADIAILAFFVIRMMRVFEVEYARRLEAANRARFSAQEEATRELSVMFETCRILGTSLDVSQLLDQALERIVSQLDPMLAGSIFLYDPAERALIVRAQRVRNASVTLTPAETACTKQAAQRAYESGSTAYVAEPMSGTSIVSVPLFAQAQATGALCLAHRAAFSNYPVIHTLARQLGIALENSRLYEQVQEKEYLRGKLLEHAVSAQEEERKRIARELHDETGQTLTALAVGLGGVEETIAQDPALAKRQISELKVLSMQAIDNLRQFVYDLRPSLLDDMGLVAALRWFAQQYAERSHLQVNVEILGDKRRLSSKIETVLFRIAQEGLNNIGRHAQATMATIRLEFRTTKAVLVVRDNGRGFDADDMLRAHPARRAWGLLGIQERMTLVGGKFSIDSAPGRGTTLRVEVPIVREEDNGVPNKADVGR